LTRATIFFQTKTVMLVRIMQLLPWWLIISVLHWQWLFIVVAHTLNSESVNLELIELTHFNCSEPKTQSFPSQGKSTQSSNFNSKLLEAPYW